MEILERGKIWLSYMHDIYMHRKKKLKFSVSFLISAYKI